MIMRVHALYAGSRCILTFLLVVAFGTIAFAAVRVVPFCSFTCLMTDLVRKVDICHACSHYI